MMQGVFMYAMYIFYIYAYGVSSELMWQKYTNPSTGEGYSVAVIVSVTTAIMIAMMVFPSVMPVMPATFAALVSAKSLYNVIEREPLIRDHENCVKECKLVTKIDFKNVKFRYPKQLEKSKDILCGANFHVRAGESTAIVGPSGSGKSTIAQLISRFYDPMEGDLFFDDLNLKDLSVNVLRKNIGYVSQEPTLIIGTIYENLKYGKGDATDDEIWEALRMANAMFVKDLEAGLDTYVGTGSVINLSGGQKQKIAIARALIRKPKILILDEATSALDSKSEREVQEAIDTIASEQKNNMTIVMIAHRLSTIQSAQNLLYLEDMDSVLAASKGDDKYQGLIDRLMHTNYAHQASLQNTKSLASKVDDDEKVAKVEDDFFTNKDSDRNMIDPTPDQIVNLDDVKKAKNTKSTIKRPNQGFMRIMSYYSPKWMAVCTVFTGFCNSLVMPGHGFIQSQVLFVLFAAQYGDPDFIRQRKIWLSAWAGFVMMVGFVGGAERTMLGYTGENLCNNVRKLLIKGIMYKQLCWFDQEKRAPGAITNIMNEDMTQLNGLTTETAIVIFEGGFTIISGLLIAFYFCWPQALIMLAASPIMVLGTMIAMKLSWGKSKDGKLSGTWENNAYEKANALLSDMIINYKTCASFGEENTDLVF
jgi:ATP-binding cassette subfamily B (MDR/TAP) protein 1